MNAYEGEVQTSDIEFAWLDCMVILHDIGYIAALTTLAYQLRFKRRGLQRLPLPGPCERCEHRFVRRQDVNASRDLQHLTWLGSLLQPELVHRWRR